MLPVACLALSLVTPALLFVSNPLYSVRDSLQLAPETLLDVRLTLLLARLALQLVARPLHSVRSRLQIASVRTSEDPPTKEGAIS